MKRPDGPRLVPVGGVAAVSRAQVASRLLSAFERLDTSNQLRLIAFVVEADGCAHEGVTPVTNVIDEDRVCDFLLDWVAARRSAPSFQEFAPPPGTWPHTSQGARGFVLGLLRGLRVSFDNPDAFATLSGQLPADARAFLCENRREVSEALEALIAWGGGLPDLPGVPS